MNRRKFLQASGAAFVAVTSRGVFSQAQERAKVKDLSEVLEAVRNEHDVPAVAAASVRGGKVVAEGVAGIREVGKPDKVTINDRFGIGSCTKRMTMLMIARLVDAGVLSFETTLGQALPEVKMLDVYQKVTLAQLLTFTGGIQPYTRISQRDTPVLFEKGAPGERRTRFVAHVLQEQPIAPPGTRGEYSNASFTLAAWVASKLAKKDYETLMQEQVFKQLGMTRSGFGRPRSKDRPDEPWLHVKGPKGFAPEPDRERLPEAVLTPAGSVHCSIGDLARFVAYELAASQGNDPLLKAATVEQFNTIRKIEKPQADFGEFGGAPWLSAGYRVYPKQDLAVLAMINAGGGDDAVMAALREVKKVV